MPSLWLGFEKLSSVGYGQYITESFRSDRLKLDSPFIQCRKGIGQNVRASLELWHPADAEFTDFIVAEKFGR